MEKLYQEDYEAYEQAKHAELRVTKMNLEATEVLLEWVRKKIKQTKPKHKVKRGL